MSSASRSHRTETDEVRHYIPHFLAGQVAGMCGAVVSHPMDTVKTRMQIDMIASTGPSHSRNTIGILRHILVTDGLRNLYKGILPPLLGYGLSSSLVFGVNNIAR